MNILITGAGGFLGARLARVLAARGELCGRPIGEMTLLDLQPPLVPEGVAVQSVGGDIADPATIDRAFRARPDVIFHLAAVVSGGAEADFDLGYRANMTGTWNLLEAAREAGHSPVVVYASSVAVHGGTAPDPVPEGCELNPQTSYGTQKAIGELLLNDFSRKGYLDGRGLRLPTVTIRPGKPNAAASSFMSSIFREPLQGESANCPVGRDYAVWHTAPRTIISNLIHAAEMDGAKFGTQRNLNLPGRTDTIGEMIEAMRRVAGEEPLSRITWQPDEFVQKIASGWRGRVDAARGVSLGFKADESFEDSVRWFLEDDHRDRA